jgi:hypothetical protein
MPKNNEHWDQGALFGAYLTTGGELQMVHRAGPNSPLERRVAILEKNLDLLRVDLADKARALRGEIASVKQSLENESKTGRQCISRQCISRQTASSKKLLLVEFTSNLSACCGYCAVLCTNISDEIARLIRRAAA